MSLVEVILVLIARQTILVSRGVTSCEEYGSITDDIHNYYYNKEFNLLTDQLKKNDFFFKRLYFSLFFITISLLKYSFKFSSYFFLIYWVVKLIKENKFGKLMFFFNN